MKLGNLSKEQIEENVKFIMEYVGFPLNPIKYIPLFFSNPKLSIRSRIQFMLFFPGLVISFIWIELLLFWWIIAAISSLSNPDIFGFQGLALFGYSFLIGLIFWMPFLMLGNLVWVQEISDKLDIKDIDVKEDELKQKIEAMKSKGIDTTDLERILDQANESSEE
tara:strand:- start:564 stop:1058 length:495 start_codon:yes stop_codon:yes gene_type:complete